MLIYHITYEERMNLLSYYNLSSYLLQEPSNLILHERSEGKYGSIVESTSLNYMHHSFDGPAIKYQSDSFSIDIYLNKGSFDRRDGPSYISKIRDEYHIEYFIENNYLLRIKIVKGNYLLRSEFYHLAYEKDNNEFKFREGLIGCYLYGYSLEHDFFN